jgi:hypothetical protein
LRGDVPDSIVVIETCFIGVNEANSDPPKIFSTTVIGDGQGSGRTYAHSTYAEAISLHSRCVAEARLASGCGGAKG